MSGGAGEQSRLSAAGVGSKGPDGSKTTRSFAQLATPGPALTIQPEETAIQLGKEVKLAIMDARIKATDQNVFKLEYDPKVLQFTRLGEAEILSPDAVVEEAGSEGTIVFRLARPSQRAPRSVTATFMAKAPGVSPIRVELTSPDGDTATMSPEVGKGFVRVR